LFSLFQATLVSSYYLICYSRLARSAIRCFLSKTKFCSLSSLIFQFCFEDVYLIPYSSIVLQACINPNFCLCSSERTLWARSC